MVAIRSNGPSASHFGVERERCARDASRIEVFGDPGAAAPTDGGAARIA
jgi:hypothetical protein